MKNITFKVQRVRSCVQCGDVLARKCPRCLKHPDRQPRVVEVYDWPPVLKTAECGCCIQIACQFPGCTRRMWRQNNRYGAGKNVYARCFCSPICSSRAAGLAKTRGREVPCAYCRKLVFKKRFTLQSWKASYCNNTCYFLARRKAAHEKRSRRQEECAAKADREARRALLACEGRCREVTEHLFPPESGERAACLKCGHVRPLMSAQKDLGLPGGRAYQLLLAESVRAVPA